MVCALCAAKDRQAAFVTACSHCLRLHNHGGNNAKRARDADAIDLTEGEREKKHRHV